MKTRPRSRRQADKQKKEIPAVGYRPQYVTTPTPEGFRDEEFEYYFDNNNTPGLGSPTVGQPILKVILQLDNDAEFIWRAIQISGNTGALCLKFYDPQGNELSAVDLEADRAYGSTLQASNPIGRLPVVFEPEIRCPAGGFLEVDLIALQ